MLLLGRQVEFVVLHITALVLQLGEFLLQELVLVTFDDELLLEFSDIIFVCVAHQVEFALLLFELCQHFVRVVDFILFDLQISFSLVTEFHIVFLKSLQLFVDSGLGFSFNQ